MRPDAFAFHIAVCNLTFDRDAKRNRVGDRRERARSQIRLLGITNARLSIRAVIIFSNVSNRRSKAELLLIARRAFLISCDVIFSVGFCDCVRIARSWRYLNLSSLDPVGCRKQRHSLSPDRRERERYRIVLACNLGVNDDRFTLSLYNIKNSFYLICIPFSISLSLSEMYTWAWSIIKNASYYPFSAGARSVRLTVNARKCAAKCFVSRFHRKNVRPGEGEG